MENVNSALLLSIAEAASALAVTPHAVRNWIREGRVRSVKLGSRRCVPFTEVQRIAEQGLDFPAQ